MRVVCVAEASEATSRMFSYYLHAIKLAGSRHDRRMFITFAIFNIFSSLCSPSMVTIGHFAVALPFNELFHCLVDNRMNEWLSVLVAATAYPIR